MQRPGRNGVYPREPKNPNPMKNRLKLIPVLLTLALAATPALRAADTPSDQPEHKREHRPGARMEHMAKELGLTADQEAKWKAIGQQEKAALDAMREDSSVAKKDRQAKRTEINEGFANQRRAILTADQAKKFDQKREENREKMREHREDRRQKGEKDAGK